MLLDSKGISDTFLRKQELVGIETAWEFFQEFQVFSMGLTDSTRLSSHVSRERGARKRERERERERETERQRDRERERETERERGTSFRTSFRCCFPSTITIKLKLLTVTSAWLEF